MGYQSFYNYNEFITFKKKSVDKLFWQHVEECVYNLINMKYINYKKDKKDNIHISNVLNTDNSGNKLNFEYYKVNHSNMNKFEKDFFSDIKIIIDFVNIRINGKFNKRVNNFLSDLRSDNYKRHPYHMCVEDGKKLYEAELKIYFSLMFFSLSKYKETYIYYYNRVVIYMIGNDSNNLSCMDIINNFNDLTFSIVPEKKTLGVIFCITPDKKTLNIFKYADAILYIYKKINKINEYENFRIQYQK